MYTKKGFLSVEVGVFLPVFLLATLALVCIIRMIGVEENVMQAFSAEATRVSKEAYVTELEVIPEGIEIEAVEGLAHGAIFQSRLDDHIERVEGKPVKELRLIKYHYLYNCNGITNIISANLSYRIDIPLPIGFGKSVEFEERLLFRGFVGSDKSYQAMGFDNMEKESDSEIVYIFPRAGNKYHNKDCRVIVVCPKETFLTPAVREKYAPCKICNPETITDGSKVYCFEKSGEAYHRGNCPTVDRYVVPIEKEDAIKEGYSPCNICGG